MPFYYGEMTNFSCPLPVYPELVALIGTTVPDYRGIFLRGHGSQASSHYGTVTHASASLGELQGDAIRNISGTFGGHIVGWRGGWGHGPFYSWKANDRAASGGEWGSGTSWGLDASRVVPVANENRPVNRSVIYLIRAK